MLAKSATPATPVTRPKSHINDSYTWVKQWFTPLENNGSGTTPNCQLKGWVKIQSVASESESSKISISSDFYDLNKYMVHSESVDEAPTEEVKPVEEPANNDLKSALSMDKREDQVSSLSGLGM